MARGIGNGGGSIMFAGTPFQTGGGLTVLLLVLMALGGESSPPAKQDLDYSTENIDELPMVSCENLMNLCHPYQGWELGVCERGFSRVSRFFEDTLGRFIWVQFGVMYT